MRRKAREAAAKEAATGMLDAEATAAMVVDTLSNLAGALVDQRAAMTDAEAKSMKDPLARSIKRWSPTLASAFSKYADPVSLVIAFGLWANRVRELRQEKPDEPSPHSAPPPDAPPVETTIPTGYEEETGATPIPTLLLQQMRTPYG